MTEEIQLFYMKRVPVNSVESDSTLDASSARLLQILAFCMLSNIINKFHNFIDSDIIIGLKRDHFAVSFTV